MTAATLSLSAGGALTTPDQTRPANVIYISRHGNDFPTLLVKHRVTVHRKHGQIVLCIVLSACGVQCTHARNSVEFELRKQHVHTYDGKALVAQVECVLKWYS